MLRKRHQMLFKVCLLNRSVIEQDYRIVVLLVPVALLVVRRQALVVNHAGRVSGKKRHSQLGAETHEIVHQDLDVAQVIEGGTGVIARIGIGCVPVHGRDESRLGPDHHVGILHYGLKAHLGKVREVALVGAVAALPGIGIVLDSGNLEGVVLLDVGPVGQR